MKKIYFSTILVLFGVLLSTQSVNAANVVLRAGGNVTTPGDWGLAPNGTTGTLTNFTAAHNYSFTSLNSAITLATAWNINALSNIVVGDGTTPIVFTIASTGSLTTPNRITFANNCTLTLNNNDNFSFSSSRTVFNTGSTVIYGPGYTQDVKSYIGNYYNVIINTVATLNGGNMNISGDLTVNSAFDMGGGTINLAGNLALNSNLTVGTGGALTSASTISGSGTFIGINANGSGIVLNGTGNIGTLNFQAGSRFLSNLTIAGGGTIALGSDLVMDGGFLSLSSGALNLNGHVLSLENASSATGADFSGGTIIGSTSSGLSIEAASLSGSLMMDATNNTFKFLYLNANGQTLTLGNSLNITDSISAYDGTIATGGNLTIKATATLKGRVGMMSASGSITGNATVEIFANGPTTGWAQLGIGGVQNQTIGDWQTQFPMTCHGCIYDINAAGTGFYSIQGWDETSSTDGLDTTAAINVNTPLTPGRGFWVYLGTGGSITNPITITNTGALVQGNVNYNITNQSQGADMTANPYASPISLRKFVDANGGDGNFQNQYIEIWNTDNGGTYEQHNFADEFSIPAGQAFFVYGFNPVQTLTFNESIKTPDNTGANPLVRTTAVASNVSGFTLTIAGSNGDFDKTEFRFNNNASTSYDRSYDGYKRFNTPGYVGYPGVYDHYTTISSRLNNTDYYRNTLPVLTNTLSVPVLVKVSATGVYTIAASAFKNFRSCAMLKDNLTGLYHNLANGDYVCTIDDTTSTPRFEMFFCEQNVAASVAELNNVSNNIGISQDQSGPFVTTHFPQNTKATISVYNVVGQQLIKDLVVEGTDNTTRLNVEAHNQVLLIRVSTDKETITKKIIAR